MSKSIKKILLVTLLLLVIFIIVVPYINKFNIATKYQEKINDIEKIGNYKFIFENENSYRTEILVKDGIYVTKHGNNDYYIVSDTNENKNYMINNMIEGKMITIEMKNTDKLISFCGLIGEDNDVSIKNMIKLNPNLKITKENFEDKDCYKIETNSIETRTSYYIYIDRENLNPIAFSISDSLYKIDTIEIGNVTQEDVTITNIINSLN